MKNPRIWLIVGLFVLLGGALLGYSPLMQYWRGIHVPNVSASPFLAQAAAAPKPQVLLQGRPVSLELPSLAIDLPVADGHYNSQRGEWTLTGTKAHYAVITAPANNYAGNTFIYGHNTKEVFANLNRIKLGDKAIITTDNGHQFTYVFKGAVETKPEDTTLLGYQGKPILTIQTCSGAWYQNRQLFTFDLENAS